MSEEIREKKQEQLANELTNVKDVRKGILYSRDGYIYMYIHIGFINIDLLPREEKKAKCKNISAAYDGDKKDFAYMTYPREIDLDQYKNDLKNRYTQEMGNIGRKHILRELLMEATDLATSGENYEHQHYLKCWMALADSSDAESELRQRMNDWKARYQMIGVPAEILDDKEILKMCNLYGNGIQASFDSISADTLWDPMVQIG